VTSVRFSRVLGTGTPGTEVRLKKKVWRGLHVLVGEVPIVWVNFQSLIVESVSVCIDEIDDVGMLQEWNADYAHLGVLVSQWIGSSTGSVWGPRQSPQNLFCDKRADTLIQLGKDRHDGCPNGSGASTVHVSTQARHDHGMHPTPQLVFKLSEISEVVIRHWWGPQGRASVRYC
jgi:hypothetical protein